MLRKIVFFGICFPLFSEGKVKTHEVTAGALILPTCGKPLQVYSGEFLVPGETVAAMHERVVTVSDRKYVSIAQVGRIRCQHLPRDPRQLVAPNNEKLRGVGVVRFDRASVPRRPLRTGRKYSWLINGRRTDGKRTGGNRIGKKNIVTGALVDAGHIKLADVKAPIKSSPIEGSIASTRARQYVAFGGQKICGPQTCPSICAYSLQSETPREETLTDVASWVRQNEALVLSALGRS